MKKVDVMLKEYVSKLSIDGVGGLKYLGSRLEYCYPGDLAETFDALSQNSDMDKWLASAKSSDELYDKIDLVQEYVDRELNKKAPNMIVY